MVQPQGSQRRILAILSAASALVWDGWRLSLASSRRGGVRAAGVLLPWSVGALGRLASELWSIASMEQRLDLCVREAFWLAATPGKT